MKCESCSHENVDGARFCAACGTLIPIETSHTDDPLIGKMVGGRFRVRRVLGEGGMGIVYEGEQQMGSTVRKVAIKTLHQHLSKDPSIMARFHRECGTVAQLEHPNTIKFYDFGTTDDGALYIAMEYVDGQALSAVIEKEGALSPERAVKIMRQVCGALDEAHQQGIIHRDLKPENIVLTNRAGETDFVKVLDFGIAGRTESADAAKEQKLTQQGMVLGTPPYMSPEQFTGKALDARSDIYSLGVMTYEIITGRLPFDATTPWEWATQHMTAQPRPLEANPSAAHLPEGIRHAIMRALSKDASQRQATARQFFAELSGGERMTVVDPAVAAHAVSGTAKMDAVPGFPSVVSGAGAPVAAAQAHAAPRGPAATAAGVVLGHPGGPVAEARGGSGKGLLFGLAGVGGVLALAIVIVIARSSKPTEEPALTLTAPSGGKPQATEIAPILGDQGATPAPTPEATRAPLPATNPGKPPPQPSSKPTGTAATSSPQPTANPTATATATATAPSSTATAAVPDACDACIAAAIGGNLQAAASGFSRCGDAAKKQACQSAAKTQLRSVQTAAASGDCVKAKVLIGALTAMGVQSPVMTKAAAACP